MAKVRHSGTSIPAPTRGWNAKDDMGSMRRDEAIILDNLMPHSSYVALRGGYQPQADNLPGAVESMLPWSGASSRCLFVVSAGEIHDCTNGNSSGALVSGLASSRWQHVNYKGRLFIANGVDAPMDYDGTSWNTTAWSGEGLITTHLIGVNLFQQRLFFVEKESAAVWYADAGAVSGVMNRFDLASYAPNGGYLQAMGTWTRDGGDGLDDFAVFLMSEGDVLIYQGSNPNDATSWSLVGIYRLGAPIGRRCVMRYGSDLIVITQDGYLPLSKVLSGSRSGEALSDRIQGALSVAIRNSASRFGWQALHYPAGNYLLFNVPQASGRYEQHIFNMTTGAWCRFTGQNGICWAVFEDRLYFGAQNGVLYRADYGTHDDGQDIVTDGRTSFQYLGGRSSTKRFTMMRPLLSSDANLPVSLTLDTDFGENPPAPAISSPNQAEGAAWDSEQWDTATWGGAMQIRGQWQSCLGIGYCVSVRLRTATANQNVRWHALDVQFEKGQGL